MWQRQISTKPLLIKCYSPIVVYLGLPFCKFQLLATGCESIHLDLLPYNNIRHHLDEMRQSSPKLQLKTVLSRLLPKS